MPYKPLSALPFATGDSPLPSTMDDAQINQWFATWIGQLSPAEQKQVQTKWSVLSNVQKNLVLSNVGTGGPALSAGQALQFVDTVQQITDPQSGQSKENLPTTPAAATPTPPTANTEVVSPAGAVSTTPVGTGTPVQGTSAATALINQYMTKPLWQGDPNDPQGAAAGLGVDFTSADTQYQQYLANYGRAQQRANAQQAIPQPMSEVSFIQGLAQSSYGQWGPIVGMLAYEWQQQNGTAMPPALAQSIVTGLKALQVSDPNDMIQLQTQMLSALTQIEGGAKNVAGASGQATDLNLNVSISAFLAQLGQYAPSVYSGGTSGSSALADASPSSIVGQYVTANPNATGVAASEQGSEKQQAIQFLSNHNMDLSAANITALSNSQTYDNMGAYVSWMQGVGMPITPDLLQQLIAMPFGSPASGSVPAAGTGGAFLLDQQFPGTHLTYGAYSSAQNTMGPLWEQYFGKAPTSTEISWAVGKSPEDVQDFINNSNSSIPGITIGQKNDYESFIDSLDTQSPSVAGINHTFSSQVDDSMMNELHQQMTAQSTATPTPGKM